MSITRRTFLKSTLGTSALSYTPFMPNWLMSTSLAANRSENNRVLVVIQLTGGNDGLNTVVPYQNDEYARSRPTLRLPAQDVHKINDELAFHPRMEAFSRLYKDGLLSIVQGVGCPNPSDDHEKAMRHWHQADTTSRQTGWLGRIADLSQSRHQTDVPVAMVSGIKPPFILTAQQAVISTVDTLNTLTLSNTTPVSQGIRNQDTELLRFMQDVTTQSQHMSQRIHDVMSTPNSHDYPTYKLAQNLSTIAQLIRADVGMRVFFTELGGDGFGGFDNHANQLGNHCALLHQLSESVSAFVKDLKAQNLLDKVLLMTFSEFGRTVPENGRRGTGHGAAAPVFLAGGKLKGGLIGEHPSLQDLTNHSLKHHTDFRQLYATALDTWLGIDSPTILGEAFDRVECLDV